MKTDWNIREQPEEILVEELASQTGTSPILARLLLQRGITNHDEAKQFLNPDLNNLHDPYLMRDMERAVDRLARAVDAGERILVYGDYDVDGVTAVALVYMALERHLPPTDNIGFYIPDRYNEGYGISDYAIEYARDNGYRLVIALDCGIKAVDRMRTARSYGIDFIICDHHVAGDEIPDVSACLDPKRQDCDYPDKNLSGCGVGFKLMSAYYARRGYDATELLDYLDLLVVSIASDLVPIVGENRIMAYHGLRQLNSRANIGLQSIMETANIVAGRVTITDLVFKVGPRINAAGRMKSGNDAVRLLISSNREEADAISLQIDRSNNERKDLDREITKDAVSRITSSDRLRKASSTVIYEPTWSKGIIGIVASRLAEMYCRPTIILTRSQANPTLATGSARSVGGFDLYRAIDECSSLLENFGGHTYAAGLTMKVANVEHFQEAFDRYVKNHITAEMMSPNIDVDMELGLDMIDDNLLRGIEQFEPFGSMNPQPTFVTRGVYDYRTSSTFGRNGRHLKLDIIGEHCRGVKTGMGFGLGQMYPLVSGGQPFDICYTLGRNDRHTGRGVLLNIKDIRKA